MLRIVRWLLILPAAIAAWYLALIIGLVLHSGLDALCPPDQVISGICEAPWYVYAEDALIAFGAALAAVLVMVACTLLAPSHRRQTAIAAFVLGAMAAIMMGASTEAYGAMAAAIGAGALLLVILLRLPSFSRPNKSLERTREG
jgi:hypothetical protein